MQSENTALGIVMELQGVLIVNKEKMLLDYKTSMAVFKDWFSKGIITANDLQKISGIIAKKYGLSSCSIYLENDLIYNENRGIYSMGGVCHECAKRSLAVLTGESPD